MPTEQIILYVLPADEDATEHQMLRLTIGEMNTLMHAKWMRLQREVVQWASETLGLTGDEEAGDVDVDSQERHERAYRRAAMLGALKRVETGTCAVDAEEPESWQECQLPDEWQGIDGFLENVPWLLFDQWLLLAAQCNPGAFFREVAQKKRMPGQVTVRSSMKRLTVS